MKKLLLVFALLILVSVVSAAIISLADDDPIQYFTINTSGQTVPVGAELHLWVSGTTIGGFEDVGIAPTETEITLTQGLTTSLVGANLTVAHTGDYWLYTQYQMYVSDLDSTLYGLTSDTLHVSVVAPVIPNGETINITLDK